MTDCVADDTSPPGDYPRYRVPGYECQAVRWDGTHTEQLRTFAGWRFKGVTAARCALIEDENGEMMHVHPGWMVYRRTDTPEDIYVAGTGCWEGLGAEQIR